MHLHIDGTRRLRQHRRNNPAKMDSLRFDCQFDPSVLQAFLGPGRLFIRSTCISLIRSGNHSSCPNRCELHRYLHCARNCLDLQVANVPDPRFWRVHGTVDARRRDVFAGAPNHALTPDPVVVSDRLTRSGRRRRATGRTHRRRPATERPLCTDGPRHAF